MVIGSDNLKFLGHSFAYFVTKLFLLRVRRCRQTFSDSSCLQFFEKPRSVVGTDCGSTGNTPNVSEVLASVTRRSRASHAFCAFLVLRVDLKRDYSHSSAMFNITKFLH